MSFVVGNAFHGGLRDGDALLAVNGRAATGTAVFGEELRKSRPETIESCAGQSANQLVPSIIAAADAFAAGAKQHDDMTLVVLRVQDQV
jgi:serine phosphatase RsbU (regulator of sigma subunit)